MDVKRTRTRKRKKPSDICSRCGLRRDEHGCVWYTCRTKDGFMMEGRYFTRRQIKKVTP